ncbi:MAG: hypothetical protein HQM10_14090 [Candidatus Riflebacteria bacterium]|nr:hypothetical protein [Candidatus Riflebacteria bacterium]
MSLILVRRGFVAVISFSFLFFSSFGAFAADGANDAQAGGAMGNNVEVKLVNYKLKSLDAKNLADFIHTVSSDREYHLAELKKKYPDKPSKIKDNPEMLAYDKILKDAYFLARKVGDGEKGQEEKEQFVAMQRLHYGILNELGCILPGSDIKNIAKMGKNLLFGPFILRVPRPANPAIPIDKHAEEESDNLYDRKSGRRVSVTEIAGMSHLEVSRLQPGAENPWYCGRIGSIAFSEFEKENVAIIRSLGGKLGSFDVAFAKRIMFFDEIKEDATSPKIIVKDRYGNKWKMKWGDELHSDLVAVRLYLGIGARFSDMKYYSGPGETILVLSPAGSDNSAEPKTAAHLAEMLLKSKFKFHFDRHWLSPKTMLKDAQDVVLGHGIIDKVMADRESIPEKYVGAYFLKLKECQLALYHPGFKRLGGSALSSVGAEKDRFVRSSMVFNSWIKNWDVKDDNSRIGLLHNLTTGEYDKQVEFFSDLGLALGNTFAGGVINALEPSFVKMFPGSINFTFRPLFLPESWKSCSYSDARWMAIRIASLKRSDFEHILAESGWPVFVQKIATEKLIARRNQLVKAFNLRLDGLSEIVCNPNLTLTLNYRGTQDVPVRDGKICADSLMVRDFEAESHPEGLAHIKTRFQD